VTGLEATADGCNWREYLEQIYQHVWAKDFWSKEIYLGVRLGQRSAAESSDGPCRNKEPSCCAKVPSGRRSS